MMMAYLVIGLNAAGAIMLGAAIVEDARRRRPL